MQVSKPFSKIQIGGLNVLIAFIIMLFVPVSGALAAEEDSLRIGGDYKFLTLREGANARECKRACDNDVSCKAWTFIKQRTKRKKGLNFNLGPDLNIGFGGQKEIIPPQCRLKHTIGPKRENECCTSGIKRVVQRARPNKAERCAEYAEKAVEQQDANLSQRCRLRGGRWHGNYRTHYRWCMDSNSRRSDRETDTRAQMLRDCRSGGDDRDRRCDRYASTAMDLLEQANENNCRSSNRDWGQEHDRIYEWCRDNRPRKRKRVLEDAQAKLAACIRRGGGPRSERCETYADRALAQVSRAERNDCRVSGTTWSSEYKTHYKACRKSNRRELRKKTQLRKDFIKRCIRRSSQARVMETGHVEVRQRNSRQWHTVRLAKRFNDPVVIMGPVSFKGADPAHARVRRVTRRGFEFRIEEFGKDGRHASETLSYLVVEKGIHRFGDTVIEAGTILTGADMSNRDWSGVRLSNRWRSAPVVLAQTQTFKGSDPVNARIKGVTRRGFDITLSEQESDRKGHAREIVAFVAITQGRHKIEGSMDGNANLWSGRVSRSNHKWLSVNFPRRFSGQAPALFALAQSSNGADAFDVRYRRLDRRGVQMRLQEEQSRDRETNHTNEVLGVVALPFGNYWSTSSSALDDQVAEEQVQELPPVVSDGDLANCRDYSERAVSQFRRSRRLSCAFSGRTWHGDEGRHRRWCRRNGLGAASDEIADHRSRLTRCKRRADTAPAAPRMVEVDWRPIRGSLKQISAGADGTVWGVSRDGKVWKRRNSQWREQRGRVKQVAVGTADDIWAVGNNDTVFRWSGRSWRKVAGSLSQISVGSDGSVWGVDASNRVFNWNGRRWNRVEGRLKQISVRNKRDVWGVNDHDEIFRWLGRGWKKMDGSLRQVAAASNGAVYGITPDNEIVRWHSRPNTWVRQSGTLRQITAGDGKRLWGVTSRRKVFTADVR